MQCTTTIHKQTTQVMISSIIIRMHNAQILIATTTMHTQHTNIYYNLGQMVKKMKIFKALLKVDSESLCLRSNGSSFHVTGP